MVDDLVDSVLDHADSILVKLPPTIDISAPFQSIAADMRTSLPNCGAQSIIARFVSPLFIISVQKLTWITASQSATSGRYTASQSATSGRYTASQSATSGRYNTFP